MVHNNPRMYKIAEFLVQSPVYCLLRTVGNFNRKTIYRKIARSNTSHLEAHEGFFRLLMKGIFGPHLL